MSSRRRRAFEEAFERDEQERERETALQRQHMTIGARRRERRSINNRMRECAAHATLVEGEEFQESLIAQGKLPYVDPLSFEDGIDLDDAVLYHTKCVSKTAVLRYLDVNRDEERAPSMFDGLAITADEMRNIFGLNPQLYRFFNSALPLVNERPVDAESEALAQQLATEEAAAAATLVETPEQFLDAYVSRDTSLLEFIDAFTRGVVFTDERGEQVLYHFAADHHQTIYELVKAFELREEALERRGQRSAGSALMLSKVEFLLTDWRAVNGNRYNIFLLGNREILRLMMLNYRQPLTAQTRQPVLSRLFTYVEQMRNDEAFVDWLQSVLPELLHFGLMTGIRIFERLFRMSTFPPEERTRLTAEVERWRRSVITPSTNEFLYAKARFERSIDRWRDTMTVRLVNINVLEFLGYFPAPIDDDTYVRRAPALWPVFINPYTFDGQQRYIYDAENANLLYRLVDNPPNGDNNLKVERLLANFRKLDPNGGSSAYSIAKDNFSVIVLLISLRQPAMLSLILEVNERNAIRHLTAHAHSLITASRRNEFVGAIEAMASGDMRDRFEYLVDRYLVPPAQRRGLHFPRMLAPAPAAAAAALSRLVNAAGEDEDEARQIEFLENFDDIEE